MARVDWQAQRSALFDISRLTCNYSQASFAAFLARLPNLITSAKQAKHDADQASQSMGQAAAELGDLSREVSGSVEQLDAQAHQLGCQEAGWRKRQRMFLMAGHVLGPLTLGMGYITWLACDVYGRKADHQCQLAKILHGVREMLNDKVRPLFLNACKAMAAAALFFAALVNRLEHMLSVGAEAIQALGSEMHLHFEEMGQSMIELHKAADAMLVVSRHQYRHVQFII